MKRLGDLPVERKNRKPWHAAIEKAIVQLDQEAPEAISLHDILTRAGIEETDAQLWPVARLYAKRIMDGLGAD